MNRKTLRNLVIKNGAVIDPANKRFGKFNLFINDGHIDEVSNRRPSNKESVIDAKGMIVTPGFIDLHTHLRDPGYCYKEDIESGLKAASAGGFTTIFCMPNTKPVIDNIETIKYIKNKAKVLGTIPLYPVGSITVDLKGEVLSPFEEMRENGVIAVSDDGNSVADDNLMMQAFKRALDNGMIVITHPEDFKITNGGIVNDGEIARKLGIRGISPKAENRIIRRDIDFAERTGAYLHIAHVSTAFGIKTIRRAKKRGVRVTCEVTPHHILLTENDVQTIGANAVMKPPLRTEEDRRALIEGILDGTVDAIATDHAPHTVWEKKSIKDAMFGVIGMETAFSVCMSLVQKKIITIERLIELFTIGPANVVKINRGKLSEKTAADITIIDPKEKYRIRSDNFYSKSKNCPFNELKVSGRIVYTICGGQIVYANKK